MARREQDPIWSLFHQVLISVMLLCPAPLFRYCHIIGVKGNIISLLQGEDGIGAPAAGGFEFGVNPDDDPELALALRVSMEEQRARQQAEGGGGGAPEGGATPMATAEDESSEEAMLQRALAMSMDTTGAAPAAPAPARDLSSMTEEEQIAYAMQVGFCRN